MTLALAPVSALEVRLGLATGSLAGTDLARATAALDDASALVRSESNGKTWLSTDGSTVTAPTEVVFVTLRAALRAYRNPDGLATESLGNGAYGYAVSQAEQGVYLTDDEKRIVRRATAQAAGGGMLSLSVPSAYNPYNYDGYWPVDPFWLAMMGTQ